MFTNLLIVDYCTDERANGWRYPLVGGTRQRHFTGTHSKPRKMPENAQTPTSRVHAVLGAIPASLDFIFQIALFKST
jgi:hypothetical protein